MGGIATERLIDLSVLQMILYDRPREHVRPDFEAWAHESGYQIAWLEAIESYAVSSPGSCRVRPTAEPFSLLPRAGRRLPRVVFGLMLTCV